ncbi:hypothetical protein [Paraburkholderia sp. J76]|uniref:hypothetical protein n=1 Tax=Paraburkholderia sp. J76 TaxID=2805439 RepID=UPI002ABE401A|nr:hypothetical protein [Paraburkholderia sp. J76]
MANFRVWKWLGLGLMAALAVAKCNVFSAEPVYSGLSVEGFNYIPLNLSEFTIRDKYGNSASGGGDLPPGSGEGSLSCCYKLKGTKFTVEWNAYDADEAIKNIYAPLKEIHHVANVTMKPVKIRMKPGRVVLAAHFYPDNHVEFELRTDFHGSRIDYSEVKYLLLEKHGTLVNPDDDDEFVILRRVAKISAEGWKKYGLTDSTDLEQYCYLYLINKDFDQNPSIQKILESTKATPGAFGKAIQALPASVVREINAAKA